MCIRLYSKNCLGVFYNANTQSCSVYNSLRDKTDHPVSKGYGKYKPNKTRTSATAATNLDYSRLNSVTTMIAALKWDSLHTRRIFKDVKFLFYKIQHKLVSITFPSILKPADTRTRQHHQYKYRFVSTSTDCFKHSFFIRTIAIWNMLPQKAVEAATIDAFQAATLATVRTF